MALRCGRLRLPTACAYSDLLFLYMGVSGSGLPVQLTSLVGRDSQIADLRSLLRTSRLVTLTGTAGTGKTRLAVEVGNQAIRDDGAQVWFVDLAPVRDPRLVGQAILAVLDEPEKTRSSPAPVIAARLDELPSLLILDNCEHVVEVSAGLVLDVLRLSRTARLLVTSRVPLAIAGEVRWPVSPLDPTAAVQLFTERAQMVAPGFHLTAQAAPVVGEICRRLDGLPLAVELAAARMGQLTVHEIRARLGRWSQLLVDRGRGVPERHRTLNAALDWSYDLLHPEERRRFARLSVFRGGFGVAGAEEVAGADLEALCQLVDQSLLVPGEGIDGRVRFRFLESVREYAAERLGGGDELEARSAHFRYFARLARAAEPQLRGPDQVLWFDSLEEELDNLRAALDWGLQHDPERAIELMGATAWFWNVRGRYLESVRRLHDLLTAGPGAPTLVRAVGLAALGRLALNLTGAPGAVAALDESLTLWRQLDDPHGLAHALMSKGLLNLRLRMPREACEAPVLEGLAVARRTGDAHHEAETTLYLGIIAFGVAGDATAALPRIEEAVELAREHGDLWLLAYGLTHQGAIELRLGEIPDAWAHLTEAHELCRRLRDPHWVPATNALLAKVAIAKGDLLEARRHLDSALRLSDFVEPHEYPLGGTWLGIEPMADLAATERQYERAARLQGAADVRTFAVHETRQLEEQPWFAAAVRALGRDRVLAAWHEGSQMTPSQALAYASTCEEERQQTIRLLTRRELEIAVLVRQGLRNRDIAGRLFISERTVDGHLEHIREKLGLHSRTEIAVWATSQRVE